jgi:hypothetical protein
VNLGADDSLHFGAMILKIGVIHMLMKTRCTCLYGMAVVMQVSVDAKCALNSNHTASRTKLASHAQRANDVPVNFS